MNGHPPPKTDRLTVGQVLIADKGPKLFTRPEAKGSQASPRLAARVQQDGETFYIQFKVSWPDMSRYQWGEVDLAALAATAGDLTLFRVDSMLKVIEERVVKAKDLPSLVFTGFEL